MTKQVVVAEKFCLVAADGVAVMVAVDGGDHFACTAGCSVGVVDIALASADEDTDFS